MKIGLVGAMVAIVPTSARCDVTLISNISASTNGSTNLLAPFNRVAGGFTMGSSSYTLTALQVFLTNTPSSSTFFELRGGSSSTPGTTALVTFTNPTFTTGTNKYSFAPGTAFDLQANTTYWLVGGTTSGNTNWVRSAPATDPSGSFATFLTYQTSVNGGTTWSSTTTKALFEIDGTAVAVPEPGTLALFSLAGGAAAIAAIRKRMAARKSMQEPAIAAV